MATKQGTLLESIPGFSAEAISGLAELWITTAEEFVSLLSQDNGRQAVAQHLAISPDEVARLQQLAVAALGPNVSFGVQEPVRYGLGALDVPEDEEPEPGEISFGILPPKVDLRAGMPPVRNQGPRSTCVAFGTIAAREYLLRASGADADLSEQFQYWNCKSQDIIPGEGTRIRLAMNCLQDSGVCAEGDWPYNAIIVADNEGQGPPPAAAVEAAKQFRISGSVKLFSHSAEALKQALSDGNPVVFSVPAYSFWYDAPASTTGDIRMPLVLSDKMEGGHCMCMAGYEDDPSVPGGGYFLVRNSWGTDWANQSAVAPGYCRIPYAYLQLMGLGAYYISPAPASGEPGNTLADALRRLVGQLAS